MDDLLEYLVKQIVEEPKKIDILTDESQVSNDVTFIIDSTKDDVPLIIGREGRTIKALRNIVSIMALEDNKRIHLEVKHQKPREDEGMEMDEEMMDKSAAKEKRKEPKPAKVEKAKKAKKSKKDEEKVSKKETEELLGF